MGTTYKNITYQTTNANALGTNIKEGKIILWYHGKMGTTNKIIAYQTTIKTTLETTIKKSC